MWLPHIDTYVSELLRLEGCGNLSNQITCTSMGCEADIVHPLPSFRCRDCFNLRLFCAECMWLNHCANPFHCIEVHVFTNLFSSNLYSLLRCGTELILKGFHQRHLAYEFNWATLVVMPVRSLNQHSMMNLHSLILIEYMKLAWTTVAATNQFPKPFNSCGHGYSPQL